jgi:hypothetical protein
MKVIREAVISDNEKVGMLAIFDLIEIVVTDIHRIAESMPIGTPVVGMHPSPPLGTWEFVGPTK